MAHKRFKKFWVSYGVLSGFGLGFSISKYYITIDLGFWYIGIDL